MILIRNKISRISIFLLIMLFFSFHSVAHADKTLTFNVTGQPPLNTKMNDGFMDEVTREALKRIGYQLMISHHPAERGLRSVNSGLIDGEMSRIKGIDKIYPNLVRVPEKIMDWKFSVFSKKVIELNNSWQSLSNKNVAFINGWKILEKNIPKSAKVTKTKNSQQLFRLLEKNRTDFIIYEHWGGGYLVNKLNLTDILVLKPALASREMFIYLHKKHTALVPQLSQALENMKKDGSYQRLEKKHLRHNPDGN